MASPTTADELILKAGEAARAGDANGSGASDSLVSAAGGDRQLLEAARDKVAAHLHGRADDWDADRGPDDAQSGPLPYAAHRPARLAGSVGPSPQALTAPDRVPAPVRDALNSPGTLCWPAGSPGSAGMSATSGGVRPALDADHGEPSRAVR